VTGFEFPRTRNSQPRETTHRAETSLPVTIFASPRNFIFVAPVEIPGSANVVTGFEFPRTRNSQPRETTHRAETSLPVTIFASLRNFCPTLLLPRRRELQNIP
jgi:hypothetical protein